MVAIMEMASIATADQMKICLYIVYLDLMSLGLHPILALNLAEK